MSWLMKVAASKFAPWILLAAALALGLSHAIAYSNGKTNGVNQERATQAEATEKSRAKIQAEHEADLKRRGWQDAKDAQYARKARAALEQRLVELATIEPRTLIETRVVTNENGCDCAVPSLGPDFWLHYRAAGHEHREADPPAADTVRTRM